MLLCQVKWHTKLIATSKRIWFWPKSVWQLYSPSLYATLSSGYPIFMKCYRYVRIWGYTVVRCLKFFVWCCCTFFSFYSIWLSLGRGQIGQDELKLESTFLLLFILRGFSRLKKGSIAFLWVFHIVILVYATVKHLQKWYFHS